MHVSIQRVRSTADIRNLSRDFQTHTTKDLVGFRKQLRLSRQMSLDLKISENGKNSGHHSTYSKTTRISLMTSLMSAAWTRCLKVSSYWDCEIAFGVAEMDAVEEAKFQANGPRR
jgi:hypothetical protein